MRQLVVGLVPFIVAAALSPFANAAAAKSVDPYSVPEAAAVENKLFHPSNELNLELGVAPLDAFYKALLFGGSYTHYYKSYWGWEVLKFEKAFTSDTDLGKKLNALNVQQVQQLIRVQYTLTTNLVYTPIYNKNLLFNQKVIHGEISLVGGAGIAKYDSGNTAPMFGGGLVFRFFDNERWSWKLDNRVYYQTLSGLNTNIYLTVGVGVAYELDPGDRRNAGKQ